jgi:hypothetical protein
LAVDCVSCPRPGRLADARPQRPAEPLSTPKDTLDDIRVCRVGEVERDVYIVGKTKGGGWAGLKSKVVET